MNNTSNQSIIISVAAYPQDLAVNIVTIALGIWTLATNGYLLLICLVHKKLKFEKQHLKIALFVSNTIYGFGLVAGSTDRLRVYYVNPWYTAYYCLTINTPAFFGDLFSLSIICCMAVERLLAIGWPLIYKKANKNRLSISLIFLSLAITVINSGIQYYGVNNEKKPLACGGSAARMQELKPLMPYFNCAVGCLTVLIYIFVLTVLRYRSLEFNKSQETNVEWYKKEVQAVQIISFVVVTNFLFLILPNIVLSAVTAQGSITSNTVTQYAAILAACNSSLNIFLYLLKDRQIRQALFVTSVQTVTVSVV